MSSASPSSVAGASSSRAIATCRTRSVSSGVRPRRRADRLGPGPGRGDRGRRRHRRVPRVRAPLPRGWARRSAASSTTVRRSCTSPGCAGRGPSCWRRRTSTCSSSATSSARRPRPPARWSPSTSPVIDTDRRLGHVPGRPEEAASTCKTTLYKERKLRRELRGRRLRVRPGQGLRAAAPARGLEVRSSTGAAAGPNLFARRGVVDLLDLLANSDAQEGLRAVALLVAGRRPARRHRPQPDLRDGLRRMVRRARPRVRPSSRPGRSARCGRSRPRSTSASRLIDLARGDEGYKDTLKTGDTSVATGYVARPSGRAFAYQAGRAAGGQGPHLRAHAPAGPRRRPRHAGQGRRGPGSRHPPPLTLASFGAVLGRRPTGFCTERSQVVTAPR